MNDLKKYFSLEPKSGFNAIVWVIVALAVYNLFIDPMLVQPILEKRAARKAEKQSGQGGMDTAVVAETEETV